jgi:hypothetical protein
LPRRFRRYALDEIGGAVNESASAFQINSEMQRGCASERFPRYRHVPQIDFGRHERLRERRWQR